MAQAPAVEPVVTRKSLTRYDRYVVLVCAFLGWFCAGFIMATTTLAMQSAAVDLLSRTGHLDIQQYRLLSRRIDAQKQRQSAESTVTTSDKEQFVRWREMTMRWFAWYQCAFLFGAAAGGLFFGRLGDRFGRARAMGLSILTYSSMAAISYFAQSPIQLLVFWFLACTGVGGMWPNGVALVAEVWSHMSRPFVAGLIGTSANIGIFLFATAAERNAVTPETWRWVLFVGAAPMVLGMFVLAMVPESPRWLAARDLGATEPKSQRTNWEIFRSPLLPATTVGILLATVPLVGAWGSANWMVPWAEHYGEAADPPDPYLKANVQRSRAFTGMIGSLCGGWIGSLLGRRRAYFLISLAALLIAQYTFWAQIPTDRYFLWWVGALGFFSGVYFGWLPLFLPELFPARVRSTGAGVSFNFGRIITAITVFVTGALTVFFQGDYARMGRVTSLIFAVGLVAILFAPDTSHCKLEE